jgi:hypothetical protein
MLFFYSYGLNQSSTPQLLTLSCINHRIIFWDRLIPVSVGVAPGRLLIGQHFLHQVIRSRSAAQPRKVGASLLALQVGLKKWAMAMGTQEISGTKATKNRCFCCHQTWRSKPCLKTCENLKS